MTRHVSGQDYSNEAQMEGLQFVPAETFQKVVFWLPQDSESLGRVHIFADRLVVEANCHLSDSVDVI